MAKKTQFQIRKEKELLGKTKDLIALALGIDDPKHEALKADVEALTEAIKEVKDTAVMEVMKEEIKKDIPMPVDAHRAYGVRLEESTMTYYLTTIEYANGYSKVISDEPFSKTLPEVHYKLGRLIIDSLLKKIEESKKKT